VSTKKAPIPGPGILDIGLYVPGEAKIEGSERPIRLASNESALGPSRRLSPLFARWRTTSTAIRGRQRALRDALGRAHGLDPARIVCGSARTS